MVLHDNRLYSTLSSLFPGFGFSIHLGNCCGVIHSSFAFHPEAVVEPSDVKRNVTLFPLVKKGAGPVLPLNGLPVMAFEVIPAPS